MFVCVCVLEGGYCQRPWMSPRSVCNWFNVCLLFPLRCHCLMTGCSSSGSRWQSTGTAARRQEAKWLLCSPCEGCLFAWLIYLPPLFGPSLFQGHAPLVLPLLFLGWASSPPYPWSARFVVESCLAGFVSCLWKENSRAALKVLLMWYYIPLSCEVKLRVFLDAQRESPIKLRFGTFTGDIY